MARYLIQSSYSNELFQFTPPIYNISNIIVPIYLYWSDADWLADRIDIVDNIITKISDKYLIQNNHLNDFNHFDFIWGMRATDEIYMKIIQIIANDTNEIN